MNARFRFACILSCSLLVVGPDLFARPITKKSLGESGAGAGLASPGQVEGTVDSFSLMQKTLTVKYGDFARKTFKLADDCKIQIRGQSSEMKDLKLGQSVWVRFTYDFVISEVKVSGPGPVVAQARDGLLFLSARDADVTGEKITIDFQADPPVVRSWSDPRSTASWKVQFLKPGRYDVEMTASCNYNAKGGTFEIAVGNQKLGGEMVQTQGTWDFKKFSVGPITVPMAGQTTVIVKPQNIPGTHLMDLQSISIKPSAAVAP
jgi:hypothetical protein